MFPPLLSPSRSALRIGFAIALLISLGLAQEAHSAQELPYGPGVSKITIDDARKDRPLEGDVWYPTRTPDVHSTADTSKVWQMAPADPDGPLAEGTFPLVVVSHGMYGNTFNQAWLGSELSRRGYIVAMVNHPGTSTWLRDPDHTRRLWDRPVDLSRLISFLTEKSAFKDRIDSGRIHAAGHSLGGFTVMLLAGARFDQERYETTCVGEDQPVACQVLTGWSIAGTDQDKIDMAASRKDTRVKKIISLDLGGAPVLSRTSLAELDVPVLVLGAGRQDMLDQERESRTLARSLPKSKVQHLELEDAGHFDFMGQCKPEGFAILKEHEPGDEIVCIKGANERDAQHQRILVTILDFLKS